MEEPTFTQLITAAQISIQEAVTNLNEALLMPEANQLPSKSHNLLKNTRSSLGRGLIIIRKILLNVDKIFHPPDTLPRPTVSDEGIGTRNWKPARPAIDNDDQAEQKS